MKRARRRRQRGSIDELPSGALRVRVYAGQDPITRRRNTLVKIVSPGTPNAAEVAEQVRTRLLNEVDERRHPKTKATVNQLLDAYFKHIKVERNTLGRYRQLADLHIRPFIGKARVGETDAEVFDSLYSELRRCRVHCSRPFTAHRTDRRHICDSRCGVHRCEPLGEATIRKVHYLLSGAYKKAVVWKWISAATNPFSEIEPPPPVPANPQPPRAAEAARILNQAWRDDPEWGTFVWLSMVLGSRRGEVCGLRWRHLDLENGVLHLEKAIGQDGAEVWEKDTKTHQDRRVVLDPDTVALLSEHWERCVARAVALGIELSTEAFIFSLEPDGSTPRKPDSVTQRYRRLSKRLGIDTHLHALRHYSATELILVGVDIRTVAGRLGHGGGGSTTLRVYAAWLSEADQRAATSLFDRLPARPSTVDPIERAKTEPQDPYEHIAVAIRQAVLDGRLPEGTPAPTVKQIAADHHVSVGTAHRAMGLLKAWGIINASRGRRAVVLAQAPESDAQLPVEIASLDGCELLDLEILYGDRAVRKLRVEADPNNAANLRQLLLDAVKRLGATEAELGEYEMNVRYAGERGLITTFAATAPTADDARRSSNLAPVRDIAS